MLSGSGSLASLITGPMATKKARTVLVLSIMPTGMISTALIASVSSVNAPLTVSTVCLLKLFWILKPPKCVCVCVCATICLFVLISSDMTQFVVLNPKSIDPCSRCKSLKTSDRYPETSNKSKLCIWCSSEFYYLRIWDVIVGLRFSPYHLVHIDVCPFLPLLNFNSDLKC